jgi:hypothetical protein
VRGWLKCASVCDISRLTPYRDVKQGRYQSIFYRCAAGCGWFDLTSL